MYHVLVAIDGDERRVRSQVETALELADEVDELRADVLYVYEEIETQPDEAGTAYIDAINENLESLQGLPDTADIAVTSLREAGVDAAVHDVTGDPPDAILAIAAEYDVDAILVGARRRSRVGKALFGSVAQKVILEADRPVLVAPK